MEIFYARAARGDDLAQRRVAGWRTRVFFSDLASFVHEDPADDDQPETDSIDPQSGLSIRASG